MEASEVFDFALFGILIRKERKDQGISSVDEFVKSIEEKTGLSVPKEALTRIESGKQEPRLSQVIAISLTLYNRLPLGFHTSPDPITLACCKKWQEMEEEGETSEWLATRDRLEAESDICF